MKIPSHLKQSKKFSKKLATFGEPSIQKGLKMERYLRMYGAGGRVVSQKQAEEPYSLEDQTERYLGRGRITMTGRAVYSDHEKKYPKEIPHFTTLRDDLNRIDRTTGFMMIETLCLLSAFEKAHHEPRWMFDRIAVASEYPDRMTYTERFEYLVEALGARYGDSLPKHAIRQAHMEAGRPDPFPEYHFPPIEFFKELNTLDGGGSPKYIDYIEVVGGSTPLLMTGETVRAEYDPVSIYRDSLDEGARVSLQRTFRHPDIVYVFNEDDFRFYMYHKSEFGL